MRARRDQPASFPAFRLCECCRYLVSKITIRADQKRLGHGVRRFLIIESETPLRRLRHDRIFFDIPEGVAARPTLLDCHVAPALMLAMAEGRDLFVQGPLSRRMIQNAYEFVEAWTSWRPALFSCVGIEAESIVDHVDTRPLRAIQAFSGGLDALYTTWYHRIGGPGPARKRLQAGLLVQGFDISPRDDHAMQIIYDQGRAILDTVDVRLFRMKTNLKNAIRIDWEMFHGAAIACALMQFSDEFNQGLIGSSGPYDALEIPWGSNPITDPLTGGAAMTIHHDGCGRSRNDKIDAIAGWPVAADNLRVCWRNPDPSKNCGTCEKCIRTALGFMANGHSIPKSLKAEISVADILGCPTNNKVQMDRFRQLRDLALRKGVTGAWVEAIGAKLQAGNSARQKAKAPALSHAA